MLDHDQRGISATPSGTGPVWAVLAPQPMRGHASTLWPTEPSIAEMMSDPVFLQIMASDRVSMDCFNGLVSVVRQRLER